MADIEADPRGDPSPIPPLIKRGKRASKSKLDDALNPPPSTKIEQNDEAFVSGRAKKMRVNTHALLVKETMQKQNL